jgi:hypothetical protein
MVRAPVSWAEAVDDPAAQVVFDVAVYLMPITLGTSFMLMTHVPSTASVDAAAVLHAASVNTETDAFEHVADVLHAEQLEH